MKKTLQDHYLLIKEGKGHKDVFIKEAKQQFPGLIRNAATYTEVANVLKTKNLINENVIGLEPINQLLPTQKKSYEVAFEKFLAEAEKKDYFDDEKAELKKPSKQVEDDLKHGFDTGDKSNPDNLIFDQIMKGYYTEMKDPKNEDKTVEELKAIVFKNLEKNSIYYTEKGQFGVKDLGYTMDAPGLGEPKEPKGKYKSSGYGDLKESIDREFHSTKVTSGHPNFSDLSADKIQDYINANPKTLWGRSLSIAKMVRDEKQEDAGTAVKKGDYVLYKGNGTKWVKSKIMQVIPSAKKLHIDWNDEYIEVDIKDVKPIKESVNEETQIRKVVRSIINEELEDEFYQKQQDLDNINVDQNQEKLAHKQAQESSTEGITQHVNYDGVGYFVSDESSEDTIATYENGENITDSDRTIKSSDEFVKRFKDNISVAFGQSPRNESLNESKIRKVIRSIINEELEEGYDDGQMGTYQSSDTRHSQDPQDIETYLNAIKGMDKVKAIEYLGGEGLSSSMVMRVINKFNRMGGFEVQDMFDVNPRVRGDVFEIRKVIRESIEKELAQINKEAEYEVLDSKLEKITDLIDRRKSRLAKLDEDEDIKALTDKKKVKQFEKEIKTLEKAKFKIEKVLAKKAKSTPKTKAIIDEDEPIEEGPKDDAKELGDIFKSEINPEVDKFKNTIGSIELEEEDEEEEEEVVSGCCSASISGEIDGEYGRCSDCGEMADVIKL